MPKDLFERESQENSKSYILACLNVISSQADAEVQTGDDVVSNKVPALQETESTDIVKISKQRNQMQW